MFKSFKWVSFITVLVLLLAKKRKKYKDLKLERRIRSELKKYKLFDERSPNRIHVLIDTINLRSAVDAALLGSKAGSDLLEGQVSLYILKRKKLRRLHSFDVSVTQSKGGPSNARAKKRLKRLGERFGGMTAKKILGQIK